MKVLTIIGPTAVGKTDLALRIARLVNGEIISADSRQVYRYMAIGTAQPTVEQRRTVRFHLIDFIDPDMDYSCGQFARDAEVIIQDIVARHHTPIVCGGTGLYIQALFNPLHQLPGSVPEVKQRLTEELRIHGMEILYKRLQKCDPEWAHKVGPTDTQRILRGLEVYELSGKPLSILIAGEKRPPQFEAMYAGLHLPRAELYERIDRRFDAMIEAGVVNETRTLLQRGFPPSCNGLQTIGFREIIDFLQGRTTFRAATIQAKQRTRQFAKRQITWFHKLRNVQWYDPGDMLLDEHLATCVSDTGNS